MNDTTASAAATGPRLHLIYARARNGVIGKDNALPWHLPEDLAHFKRCTLGCTVIMGRKTWDSLPARFRPLPGRQNVVISRQSTWRADGATTAASLDQALALCAPESDVWVIGGAQIYAQALPLACTLEVTEIDADFEGDAFAPLLTTQWVETARETGRSAQGLDYAFVSYQKHTGNAA